MKTLLLDRTAWDLLVDSSGNIAVAADPYSMAQDAASNIKLFQGELYFNTTQGIPYYTQILGQAPSIGLIKGYFVNAALLVPGVVTAKCFVSSLVNRVLHGQVQVTDSTNTTTAAGF